MEMDADVQTTCPPPFDFELAARYRQVMKRFERLDRFGWEFSTPGQLKGKPLHRNSRSNPRPDVHNWSKDGKHRYRKPDRIDVGKEHAHLLGERALFHISRPDRRVALYALDIDGEEGSDYQEAAAFVRDIVRQLWPGLEPFVEPGRSYPRKGGCYGWIRVDWGKTAPAIRREFENALNRVLWRRFRAAPPGITCDGLKGSTWYEEPNRHFDARLAHSIHPFAGKHVDEVQLPQDVLGRIDPLIAPQLDIEDGWIPRKSLVKLNRWLPEPLPEVFQEPGQLPERTRWKRITYIEHYERQKIFYGIRRDQSVDYNQRISYRRELEEIATHFGILVTRPCYAAFRGDRPNNIADFVAWTVNDHGVITRKLLEAVLPADEVARICALEAGQDGIAPTPEPPHAPAEGDPTCPPANSIPEHRPTSGTDADRLAGGDCWLAKVAAARTALRQTDGDADSAVPLAREIYEATGLATGMTAGDRSRRLEDARRGVQYASQTFDSQKAKGYGQPWFDADTDVDEMQRRLRGRIARRALCGRSVRSPLSYGQLAHVACWVIKNILTGNPGYVPFASIAAGLKYHGVAMSNAAIAHALVLLRSARMIVMVADYCPGRCRRYLLHPQAIVPDWASAHVREDIHVHETAGTYVRVARSAMTGAATHACPSSFPPLRTGIQETNLSSSLQPAGQFGRIVPGEGAFVAVTSSILPEKPRFATAPVCADWV